MRMSRKLICTLALLAGAALTSVPASATSASGTVAVTATISSSVSLTFISDGSGIPLGGTGTSAATIAFGSVQAFGVAPPAGVTRTVNLAASNWTLSTPFDVVVAVANQASASYTLTAQMNSADAYTWALGLTPITSAIPATLTVAGGYAPLTPFTAYTLNLTIPFGVAAGAVNNTINFVATAN